MSLGQIVEIIHSSELQEWKKRNEDALKAQFGGPQGRYPAAAAKAVQLRAPDMKGDSGVPFSAYIHPSNPTSGPYGGFSFVIFPSSNEPALLGLVVGTQGLAPDEAILGRPGHARKAQAIGAWLNREFGKGEQIAWTKQDPTRTDITVPDHIQRNWPGSKDAFNTYGNVMYALFRPTSDRSVTLKAVAAFLDLMFEERGIRPNAPQREDSEKIRSRWFNHLMPQVDSKEVKALLEQKRFVVIQGPPGTGKTTMALDMLADEYKGAGRTIQLHPNTTYETFIGGLSPDHSDQVRGLQFRPNAAFLCKPLPTR